MAPMDRVAFLAGFVQFAFEMVQQVLTTVVTSQACHRPDIEEPADDRSSLLQMPAPAPEHEENVFVQMPASMQKSIHLRLQTFQQVLASEKHLQAQKAKLLLHYVESRYVGVAPWEMWGEEVQHLQACLVGHTEEGDVPLPHAPDPAVLTFVEYWWRQLLPMLQCLDRHNACMLTSPCPGPSEGLAHQDLEEDRDIERDDFGRKRPRQEEEERDRVDDITAAEVGDSAMEAEDDAYEMDTQLQAARVRDAREFQNWEDWVLAEEMRAPRHQGPRLRLDVSATSSSGSSQASTATLHVPLPPQGGTVLLNLALHLGQQQEVPQLHQQGDVEKLPSQNDAQEEDVTNLMQNYQVGGSTSSSSDTPLVCPHRLCGALAPDARRDFRAALRNRLMQWRACCDGLLQECDESQDGPGVDLDARSSTSTLVQALLAATGVPLVPPHLRFAMGGGDLTQGEASDQLLAATGHTRSVLPQRDVCLAADEHAVETAELLQRHVHDRLMDEEVELRDQALRALLLGLVHQTRDRCARLKLLTQLLAEMAPQPTVLTDTVQDDGAALGRRLCAELMAVLDAMTSEPVTAYTSQVLDFDWLCQETGNLGSLAMHLMAFLENGAYDDETSQDAEATDSVVTVLPWGSAEEATYWGGAGIPPEVLASRRAPIHGDKAANEAIEHSRTRRTESTQTAGQLPDMIEVADTLLEGDDAGPVMPSASSAAPRASVAKKRPAAVKQSGVVTMARDGMGSSEGHDTKYKKTMDKAKGKGQGGTEKGAKGVDKRTLNKGAVSGMKSQGKRKADSMVRDKGAEQHAKFQGKGTVRAAVRAKGQGALHVSSTLDRGVVPDIPVPGEPAVLSTRRAKLATAAKGSTAITEFMRK